MASAPEPTPVPAVPGVQALPGEAAAAPGSGAHLPLALDATEGAWQVEAGTVEVFAVPRGRTGPRTHLLTVGAGGLLCALSAVADGRHGLTLLAVGGAGTRLTHLPVDRLRRAAADTAGAPALARQLDDWLSGLARGLARPPAPKGCAELEPGTETRLEAARLPARAREGVAWVRHLEGRTNVLGEAGLTPAGDGLFPVPEGMWLSALEPARLTCHGTVEAVRAGEAWPGLAQFHALFLAAVAHQRERLERQDRERLERRQERDRATLGGAYARLASVLLPGEPGGTAFSEDRDALLLACRRVGALLGIEVRERPEGRRIGTQGEELARIAAAAHVRYRRVILRGDWWRRDNGPLIAFRASPADPRDRHAVALLPASARRYTLVEADGARVPVDEALAESLEGDAYMLYPALPARPVGMRDVARLAFAGRRRDLLTVLAMGLAGGLLGLLLPILTGHFFGSVIPGAQRGQLLQITLALFVGAVAGGLFHLTRSLAVLRLGGKIDGLLQAAVWDRLLALPAAFFRRYSVGDLASRALGVDAIRDLLTGNVLTVTLSAIFSLFSFALLFSYSARLALLASAMVVALTAVATGLYWLQLRHQRAILDLQGRIASLAFGLIHGIAKLRVAGAESRAFARWAERFAEQRRRTLAAQRAANAQTAFSAVYSVLTSLGIFAMVGLSARGALPMGDFLAFNAAFGQFLSAALSLVSVVSSALAAVPVYERLRPILETVPEVDASKAEPGELAGAIEFSHVSFRYQPDGPPVLDNVSFAAAAGEFIALVGPSGAGKSTSLRLILGFERPTAGSIYFDGQDLAGLAVASVRRQIGVVLQTGRPMAGSLFSNIVGSADLGIDDAWEAARAAGLEDDIKAMPMGMHTVVSEGAETFSGGQKQRILIARAIVHRPRILLFDEATSALDNRTQEIVSRSLERLKATRIVIAHRLSTIQNADRIYVFDAGRVVEQGSFQELLQSGGVFPRLAARQIA